MTLINKVNSDEKLFPHSHRLSVSLQLCWVKFPNEITVHLELPEEMHEEQIERLIDEIHLAAKGSKVRTRVNITSDKN